MISGMFHLQTKSLNENFKIEMHVMLKKIVKVICAIVFWTLVYHTLLPVIKYLFGERNPIDLSEWAKIPERILFGPGWPYLWFLYILIGLYLATPLIRLFISRAKREHIEYCLVLFFLLGACVTLYNTANEWINGIVSWFPASDIYFRFSEIAGPYTGYYIAGYYFSHYTLKRKTELIMYFLAVASILFTIFGSQALSLYKNNPSQDLFGVDLPNTMLAAFGIFLFTKKLCMKVNLTAGKRKILTMFSKATLGIYLVHYLVLQVVIVHLDFHVLLFNPVLSVPVISIVIFFISFICTMVIKRIPILNKYVV
jgi:surface polysaccharide O-acyltransferase-like enzyme